MLSAHRTMIALAVAGLVGGCVARPATSLDATRFSDRTLLTADELAGIARQGSLMDALQQLRPAWLWSRGGATPAVSVDGAPPAELSFLRTIPASTVREVRFERSSSNAGMAMIATNGNVIVGDVIRVTSRRGSSGELQTTSQLHFILR